MVTKSVKDEVSKRRLKLKYHTPAFCHSASGGRQKRVDERFCLVLISCDNKSLNWPWRHFARFREIIVKTV